MDYQEEQEMEIEALQSIFEDNFELEESNKYSIMLYPSNEEDEDAEVWVVLKLLVTYPEKYPEEQVKFILENVKGVNRKKQDMLTVMVNEKAQESLGDVCVFDICDMLKEWMDQNNFKEKSLHEEMMEKDLAKKKKEQDTTKEEQGKEEKDVWVSPYGIEKGTLITKETFDEWNAKFLTTQKEALDKLKEEDEKKRVAEGKNKLTGRAIFQSNRSLGSDAAAAGEKKESEEVLEEIFCYNEDLYGDDDDDDDDEDFGLDDEEEEEEEDIDDDE